MSCADNGSGVRIGGAENDGLTFLRDEGRCRRWGRHAGGCAGRAARRCVEMLLRRGRRAPRSEPPAPSGSRTENDAGVTLRDFGAAERRLMGGAESGGFGAARPGAGACGARVLGGGARVRGRYMGDALCYGLLCVLRGNASRRWMLRDHLQNHESCKHNPAAADPKNSVWSDQKLAAAAPLQNVELRRAASHKLARLRPSRLS